MAKINIGFKTYTDLGLLEKANFIIVCMTNNPHFADPQPLADVEDAVKAYNLALIDATEGGTSKTLIKNKNRYTLETSLTRLGTYIQLHAYGDELILSTTGYDLAKKKSLIGVLPKPQFFKVKQGAATGSIKLKMKAIAGATNYLYEYKTLTETEWKSANRTCCSATISGLKSGEKYIFRCVGIGTNLTRVYSDEISSYVL